MQEAGAEDSSKGWNEFVKKHWKAFVLFTAAAALAVVWAILVFLWYIGQAQMNGLVPLTLDMWTIGHLVSFLLNLLFWMIVLAGIPVGIGAGVAWLWFRRLPADERGRYRFFRNRSRGSSAGNAISFLVFIGFLLKVYIDGNWNVPIATWTFEYLIYSWVTVLAWLLIIFAIPAAIGLLWWIGRQVR